MTTYGRLESDEDLWALIDSAVREADDDDCLCTLRIGETAEGGEGRHPLPFKLLGDVWFFGYVNLSTPSAVVDYLTSEPMIEDERCWTWKTDEDSGRATSLQEAMKLSEEAVNGRKIL